MDAGGAFAAYITGNVASNLIGRLISAAVADSFGLASNFYFFALLNLTGAVLVYFTIQRVQPMHAMGPRSRRLQRRSNTGAIHSFVPPSASASASCSPSSAPSPSSISYWCARRYRSG